MKVSELEGDALDYWVGRALGFFPQRRRIPIGAYTENSLVNLEGYYWECRPSTVWEDGGPLIQLASIEVGPEMDFWVARCEHDALASGVRSSYSKGYTPLIAAMRCFVASKLGPEVQK